MDITADRHFFSDDPMLVQPKDMTMLYQHFHSLSIKFQHCQSVYISNFTSYLRDQAIKKTSQSAACSYRSLSSLCLLPAK